MPSDQPFQFAVQPILKTRVRTGRQTLFVSVVISASLSGLMALGRWMTMDRPLHVVCRALPGRYRPSSAQRERPRAHLDQRCNDDPLDGAEVHALDFNDMDRLVESLRGAEVLYNTYWVRYNKRQQQFAHTRPLKTRCDCLRQPRDGVKRSFNQSPIQPRLQLDYFEGKVQVENLLKASGYPTRYCGLRCCLVGNGTCSSTTLRGC